MCAALRNSIFSKHKTLCMPIQRVLCLYCLHLKNAICLFEPYFLIQMKKIALVVTAFCWLFQNCSSPGLPTPAESVHQAVRQDMDSFYHWIDTQMLGMAKKSLSTDSLQKAFLAGRIRYKKIEHITEYYMPSTTRLVNGPPLPEIEMEENKIFEPGGLQVLEEILFPVFDTTRRGDLITELGKLRSEVQRYGLLWDETPVTDAHVFDAIRLQTYRIITLGISGFDAPLSKNSMQECAVSLSAMRGHLKYYVLKGENPASFNKVDKLMNRAIAYLQQNRDFDSFDRMHFITAFANPITTQLWNWQQEKNIAFVDDIRPFRASAKTLFEENSFDPNFYTTYIDRDRMTAEKVELGRKLFYDPVLSANSQRSCATCHQPDKAFTDGLVKSENIHKNGFAKRNTPTILNAALQKGQFYDLRTFTLESQTQEVIENKNEMHGNMQQARRKLQADRAYLAMFRKAFPDMGDSIQPLQIQNALGSYERSLLSFNARFDKYVRGDRKQMNAQEISGFNLFMGKAKCGACHFMPVFNGTVPPNFIKTESEVLGVPASTAKNAKIDPDMGRYAINPLEPWKYAFKTTTVRNIALTAPYMHNGVYRTLEEVVDFYNKGGGAGMGMDLPNQTLPFDKLNLTKREQQDVVAFMKTLTDTSAAGPAPKKSGSALALK